jgi:large subunit ribosomal protein L23
MALFGNKKTETNAKAAAPKKAATKVSKKEEAAVSMSDLYTEATVKTVGTGNAKDKKEIKIGNAYRVLVKPLITEKATNLSEHNKYVFVVSLKANKISVAKAIEETYGVKPLKVNLANVSGKKVARGKVRGQRKDWRKAIVTLPKGQTIKIYEGV